MMSKWIIASFYQLFSQAEPYKFPDHFKFGVATSAYQIEGAWNVDGKGFHIWDMATHNQSHLILDGSNADITCNSYYKWEEDIDLIKNLGVDFYRFSISWARIFPDGYVTNKINQAGIDYYNKIINTLLEHNIEPVVTLYHWDLPQIFSPLGAWTNPAVIEHFASYARKMFQLFGDRVKMWITINEPRLVCQVFKGSIGDITPDFPLGIAEYLCAHNIVKAHAEAYHIYDKEFRHIQKGKISITVDMTWWLPENASSKEDVRLAEQNMQFDIGLYVNPILNYDYPKVVIDRVAERSRLEGFPESRLPKFSYQEKNRISGTYDFLGINHYFTMIVKASQEPPVSKSDIDIDSQGEKFRDPNWEPTGLEIFKVLPESLRNVLKWVKKTYHDPEIYITENGYADNREIIDDDERINYFRKYLNATVNAIIEDKVNVVAYTAWSLMDNFEWILGYEAKFGLYHVNFTDPNRSRTPKKSVEFFKRVTKTRTIN
ncbi:myrosinase 1-like isoform X2 [Zophobas morio]|uniref:myrosinase 1-like isoform X2 n=1 Tax=Zophobas morio TaxID=2755281 RepID=UPI00308270EF